MTSTRGFSDFAVGDTIWFERVFELDAFEPFAELSGDRNPLHNNPEYARTTSFGAPILPVHLAASPLSAIAGMAFPGESSLYLEHTVRAHLPIYYGDRLVYSARVTAISPARRVLILRVCVFRELDFVLQADMTVQARYDGWSSEPAWEILKASRKRTCLITGASGAIGLATAKLAAARGWNLILHHRSGNIERIAAECGPDARIQVIQSDLSTEAGARHLAAFAATADVDAVVHCASAPIDATIGELVSTNFCAFQFLRDAVLGSMLRKQEGKFILVGSQAVDFLNPKWANYAAAKMAAETVVRGIAKHYGHIGIQAGTLAPSFVESSFSDGWRPSSEPAVLPEYVAEHIIRMLEGDALSYRNLDAGGVRDRESVRHQSVDLSSLAPSPTAASEFLAYQKNGSKDNGIAALDDVVRRTLKLPGDSDLSHAGLGLTPTWDSLAHIQLIVAIEQELGLSFTSQEIDHLLRYPDLRNTCEQKLRVTG
jgi:short-subunit dehydrogenase/acyl dehydratase